MKGFTIKYSGKFARDIRLY